MYTHDRRVAGAGLDLLTISERHTLLGSTEVDEVVARSRRGNLPSFWSFLTIAEEARLNLGFIEGYNNELRDRT